MRIPFTIIFSVDQKVQVIQSRYLIILHLCLKMMGITRWKTIIIIISCVGQEIQVILLPYFIILHLCFQRNLLIQFSGLNFIILFNLLSTECAVDKSERTVRAGQTSIKQKQLKMKSTHLQKKIKKQLKMKSTHLQKKIHKQLEMKSSHLQEKIPKHP